MPEILDSHITVCLECTDCGHQWDTQDEDSLDIQTAIERSGQEQCPECSGGDE